MEEILLINKPKGITSFDVIRILRKKLGIKKMGHAGTLDPMATGLMIIGVNKGTKKLNNFIKLDKVYEAEILLGIKTETGDMEGKILNEVVIDNLDAIRVKVVIESIQGTLILPVPRFSAIKIKGKRLYEMARKEQSFEVPLRKMIVYSSEFIGLEKKDNHYIIKARFHVASGTYIRSIAEEVGNLLNLPATLFGLIRTKIGDYCIEDSVKLIKD